MIKEIFTVSEQVAKRELHQVMMKLMEEVGELAVEVNILEGYVLKEPGQDGIIGEGVDCIICILDLIKLAYGNSLSEEVVMQTLERKLQKWKSIDRNKP